MREIRLSNRLNWSAPTADLWELRNSLQQAGERVTDLASTDPTGVELALPWEEMGAALGDASRWSRYRPDPQGEETARQALAELYRSWGEEVGADQFFLAASTSEFYSWLFQILCDAGDRVLVPEPGYPLFGEIAALAGAQCAPAPLEWCSGRWSYSPKSWRVPARTRALVIVAPHNPTGVVPTSSEWDEIAAFCRLHSLVLIVDEVFRLSQREVPEQPRWNEMGVPVVVLSGLSKWLGAPQLKLSWGRLYGPNTDCQRLLEALERAADATLNLAGPVQAALPELLKLIPAASKVLLERLEENRQLLGSLLKGLEGAELLDQGGAWYGVVGLRQGDDEELARELLQQLHLFLHPGFLYDFGSNSDRGAVLVLGLLLPPLEFRNGLEKLLTFLIEKGLCSAKSPHEG